jgi:DNA-binding MarR family transcriptional regulator
VPLDPVIHQPVRLRIAASLAALEGDAKVDFTQLRNMLGVTDGNLGAHLQKLEEAGYVVVEKIFVQRKPRTYLALTVAGRRAFEDHIAALRRIIDSAGRR